MTARFDLTPFDRWEAVSLDGVHAGFLHRRLREGVLTTRMAFQPTGAQRRARADLPERYLAQARVAFTDVGATWTWCDHEDSVTAQRVRIDRERVGLAPDVVPSWAEHLLVPAAAAAGGAEHARLEEASPLQGPLRMPRAVLRVADADSPGGVADRRVEVVSEGHVLAVHTVRAGVVVASDWGGGTASAPVATQAEALESLAADLHTFAALPH
ncbi:hypothetical protein [uncultured Micrococcus sp.]|uniref:hypothetical protein n=1 Tax=uncultured Micrococcus sp. TaxID=114051 RepID=UPI0025EC91B2|nr:hypothetical protein [uncultured Micrococcus sp.]